MRSAATRKRRCAGSAAASATSPRRCARQGFEVSQKLVGRLLRELGYSCQANRKTREGTSHPDRNAQFAHINATVQGGDRGGRAGHLGRHQEEGAGRRLQEPAAGSCAPRASPSRCGCTTSRSRSWARSRPMASTTSPPTGLGQCRHRCRHRRLRGREHPPLVAAARPAHAIPKPGACVITADCGGSNGARVRLWKRELQRFANETGLAVTVAHLPPGTSKWNRIEHRLFAYISQNWRGKPLRQPSGHHPADRRHHDQDRPHRHLRHRRQPLSQGHQGLRCRDGRHQHRTPHVPRRLELHHQTGANTAATMKRLFRVRSLGSVYRRIPFSKVATSS